MSSIKEVAERAGVSIATVSNVFNDPSKVKDLTKAKVLRAAAELHYNGMDKLENRINKTGKTIGIIAEDLTVFNTPDIIHAICSSCEERGWDTLICNLGVVKANGTYNFDELECSAKANSAVTLLISNNAEGIIYVGCQCREIKYLATGYDTPVVYAYCYSRENNAPSVVYEDENISYELIQYLIQKGHRNIGIITGGKENVHVRERLLGFQKAHYDAGILYNPNNIVVGDLNDSSSGYSCIEKLLANRITAVFCMNDVIALGVYDYAFTHNIKIPEQLAVVGFDNRMISTVLNPRLTTVALPLTEIGVESVRFMEKLLDDRNFVCGQNIIPLNCRIIFRSSV